jgi:hypothetical protein
VDDIAAVLQKRPLQFALMVSHEQPWPALPPADVGPDATRVYGTGTDLFLHAWLFANGICNCLPKVTNLIPEFEKSPFVQVVLQLWLSGNGRRDLLIGGNGTDIFNGIAGNDIIVARTTDFDRNEAALAAIMAEWSSNHSYAERVANLSGNGAANRLNGDVYLIAKGPAATVHVSNSSDLILASDSDWIFAGLNDHIIILPPSAASLPVPPASSPASNGSSQVAPLIKAPSSQPTPDPE